MGYDFDYSRIKHICFNLTNQCNCRCKYCFTHWNPKRMELDTFKKAILFGKENLGLEKGTFFGGEPMLEYDRLIVPIVLWCEENNIEIKWGMTTNGTHFTDERLDFLKEHHIGFLLSIDGDKESQDYNRPLAGGGSSFDLISPYLDRITHDFQGTTFRSTVTPFSAKNLVHDYLFAREKGFLAYYIVPDCMNSEWTEKDKMILYENYSIILELMYRDIVSGVTPLNISQFVKSVREVFPYLVNPQMENAKPIIYRCGLGTVSLGISPEGYISGCQEHSTYENDETPFFIGDIYNGIDREKHIKLLSYIEEKPIITSDSFNCNQCPSRQFCSHQYCPSHNFINCHDLTKQDEFSCQWQNFQNQQALLLLDKGARENNSLFMRYLMSQLKKS